jgi:phage shock protein C
MFCTKCGVALNDQDRFCRRCGHEVGAIPVYEPSARLMLDKRNKKLAGVCAGLARYWGTDVTLIRVIWLVLAICAGTGFLAYLICCIAFPSDEGQYMAAPVTS